MTPVEITLFVAWALWWAVCSITAVAKRRGLGWGAAAALFPPLYIVLLLRGPGTDKGPTRARCPRCKMGWVPLDRTPRVCSGCGEAVSHAALQDEIHKDMM